eukprot:TRINITY_DN30429_c0_g1_i1.p1 TRINITY_DN30429_c0_g1~~TRINITY_DN30429_c0_g1_i1.p1  ORF type:complete len:442 (+),score=44.95 TRINITY_DN30429_c0_g1_i1:111-1436(+)
MDKPMKYVVCLGINFLLIYLAFNGAQNLLTSSDDEIGPFNLGSWSLGTLYLANTISGLAVAVPATCLSTDRNVMVYWVITIPIFLVCNVVFEKYTLVPASFIAGIGAGVLWTANAGYLSSCISLAADPRRAPLLTGVFYFFLQSSQIFGNLSSSIFLHHIDHGRTWLFVFYCAVCLLGMGGLLMMPNLEREHQPQDLPLCTKLMGIVSVTWNDTRMKLLALVFIYSGMTQTFFYGVFPDWVSETRSDEDIGYVMALFGVGDALFSLFLGWLGSRVNVGVFLVITVSVLSCCGGMALLAGVDYYGHHTLLTFMAVAFQFGIADAGFNAMMIACISVIFPKAKNAKMVFNSICGFAALQTFQACTTAISFFYNSVVTKWVQLLCLAGTLAVAYVSFGVLVFKYMKPQEQSDEFTDDETQDDENVTEKDPLLTQGEIQSHIDSP